MRRAGWSARGQRGSAWQREHGAPDGCRWGNPVRLGKATHVVILESDSFGAFRRGGPMAGAQEDPGAARG